MRRVLSGVIGFTGALLVFANVAPASAQIEASGNVSFVNDYTFRGISQTLETPAVQGGVDFSLPNFLYAGLWGSSVNFGEDIPGEDRATMELDVYGGIAPSIAGFDVNLGALYYMYPEADADRNYDYLEFAAGLGRPVGPFGAGVNVAYSPDFFAASGTGLYYGADLDFALPGTPLSLDGSLGRQMIEDNGAFGTPDYTTWSAGASVEVLGVGIGGGFTGTNLGEDECFGGTELCGTRFIVSVGI